MQKEKGSKLKKTHQATFTKTLLLTLRLHSFSSQPMLQVFHTDVLSILTRVPEVKRYVVDCRATNVTAVTTAKTQHYMSTAAELLRET